MRERRHVWVVVRVSPSSPLCLFSSALTLARSSAPSRRTLITLAAGIDCVKTRLENYYPERDLTREESPAALTARVISSRDKREITISALFKSRAARRARLLRA